MSYMYNNKKAEAVYNISHKKNMTEVWEKKENFRKYKPNYM